MPRTSSAWTDVGEPFGLAQRRGRFFDASALREHDA